MTISVVNRETIGQRSDPSLLPTLTEQVPGLFTTSRGVMGYGVSNGAAGGISLRGIGGSPTTGLLVLIDGHPQYMGLMGHPIADAYQSMLAEKVEVVRGPASVLYGSNAMGGVINIVTRRQREDGVRTGVRLGYGSYDTWMTEATNQEDQGLQHTYPNGTTGECNIKCFVHTICSCCIGCSNIRLSSYCHTTITGDDRKNSTAKEANCCKCIS